MDAHNILWIVLDTVRFDHLSCYGHKRKTTPNIDKVAESAFLFENAFSSSHWTPPGHASMFTGQYPYNHGVYVKSDKIPYPNFGDLFPNTYEKLFISTMVTLNLIDGDKGFDNSIQPILKVPKRDYPLFYRAQLLDFLGFEHWAALYKLQKIKDFVKVSTEKNKPFFIFTNFDDAHFIYNPPRPYKKFKHPLRDIKRVKKLAGHQNKIIKKLRRKLGKKSPYELLKPGVKVSEEEFDALKTLYDGEIFYLDTKLGELFDYLKTIGVYDNTVIVITADHGESFGEHNLIMHHRGLYSEETHVPLIIKVPGMEPKRIPGVTSLVDVLPTLLHLANIKSPRKLDGKSLLPPKQHYHDYIIIESINMRAIRTDTHYLISFEDHDELYDITKDPKEEHNIIKENLELANKLKIILVNHSKDSSLLPCDDSSEIPKHIEGMGADDEKKVRERLKDLGYLD